MPTYWIFFHTSAYVGAIRRSVTGPLSYAYVNVRYMYNSAYVRRSLCISFKNASDTLGKRFYTLIQV